MSCPWDQQNLPKPSQLHLSSSGVEPSSQVLKKYKQKKINCFLLHIISKPFSCAVTKDLLDSVFSLGTEAAGLFYRAFPGFALPIPTFKHSIS